MCILCVVQRWSRRLSSMLPWLIVPLLVLWLLSQLLPPNLRFEITSPRLACVMVLLMTLFWYEILMPKLSIWRARRTARLRERRRIQAIELQKLRRTATRRCRNCLTPYRDQNPGGGGKFMCCYCGHVSKRPVLDLSGWPDWNGDSSGDFRCFAEKAYSAVCTAVVSIGWVVGKVFRRSNGGSDGESRTEKKGENGEGLQESRAEKARRKAEEKRQARIEREMLEEEERKQREEVAKLVEERRKLRDEMLEAERGRSKVVQNNEVTKKEAERKKKERRTTDKDKSSSKSVSDGEDQERKKRDLDKRSEIERQRALLENVRSQLADGNKSKSRYFDRVKGSFLSPSKGLNTTSFFGRNAQSAAAPAAKANKPATGFVDHSQNSGIKRESQPSSSTAGKPTVNGGTRTVGADLQHGVPPPKKGWHQLFTRSSVVSPEPVTNNNNSVRSANDHNFLPFGVDNGLNFGRSLPLSTYSSPKSSSDGKSFSHVGAELNSLLEDTELFEDPCYIPDSMSFLGPVSEPLNNIPLDLGIGFVQDRMMDGPRVLKNVTALPEIGKPSPIESPLSKLRVAEEKQGSRALKPQKSHFSNLDESSNAQTWQMWGSPTPLPQDALGIAGGNSNWFSPLIQNRENASYPLGTGLPTSIVGTDCLSLPSIHSNHNGGAFGLLHGGPSVNDQWVNNSPFPSPIPADGESHFLPFDLMDNMARNEVKYTSPSSSDPTLPVEVLQANGWPKEELASVGSNEESGNQNLVNPPNYEGFFSRGPDVQSVWSHNHE